MPEGSNYEITVTGGKGYLGKLKTAQAPGGGIDFVLESSGSVTGKVTGKITGEPFPNAIVEAYSESRQGAGGFAGVGVSGKDGFYTIDGLRKTDQKGNLIDDYVVTVYAPGYPPLSRVARKADDKVDFTLSRGKENELSGTVMGVDGELIENIDFTAHIFEQDHDFVTFVRVNSDGSFKIMGLNPNKQYLLKLTASRGNEELLIQWAGESGEENYDTGFENPADPDIPPSGAKAYKTDTTLHFRFSRSIPISGVRRRAEIREISGDPRRRQQTAISSTTHTDMVSGNPYITVTWESAGENVDGYYFEFNQVPDHRITIRNAPGMLPVKIRQVTSGELTGDNIAYYFHVAHVDNRGKIRDTSTREFRIDTVPPSNGSVIAPETTSERIITLNMGVMDAKEMYISNIGYGQGGDWETRVKTRQWELAEGDGSKTIYVQFRDEARNVSNFTVTTEKVVFLNHIPVVEDQAFSVDENSPGGTAVGTVPAGDDDPGDTLSFSITAGNTGDAFAISSTGEITVSSQLDYETTPVFMLTVEVSDGMETASAIITININNLSENSPTVENRTFSVDENSTNGTVAGTVTATDPDPDDILTYSITGDAFAIDSTTGEITVQNGTQLDYETTPVFTLTVQVSDGTNAVTALITININDVNEVTLSVDDQVFTIDENSANGTSVGTVVASGPGDALFYSITAGNTGEAFAIGSNTGEIRVNDSSRLDYETTLNYALAVQVSDSVSTATAAITININNLSEYNPEAEDAVFSVNENSSNGTIVGMVSATDADPGDTLSYGIATGNTRDAFTINSNTGEITVRDGTQLDYETASVYALTVEVSDGMNIATAAITVNINDVNEEVLTARDQAFTADENSAGGTSVGVVVASGPIDTLAYAIMEGNTDNAFAVNSSTGEITVSSSLDYETIQAYALAVEVSDGASTVTATVTIDINDLSEYIPATEDAVFTVDENSPGGTVVGAVTASDADPDDTLAYRITAGNTNNAFSIEAETGVITVNNGSELDYETTPVYSLTVQVSDGVNTATALVTVNINDVDEEVLVANDQTFTVDENSANGTTIGTIVASGPIDTLLYNIIQGNTDNAGKFNNISRLFNDDPIAVAGFL